MSNRILKGAASVAVGLVSALSLAGLAQAQPGSSDCDAYIAASAWCEPGVLDYDCDEIPIELRPIDLVNPANDPFRLDADSDSIGCELPGDGTAPGETADDGMLPETGSTALLLGGLGIGALVLAVLLLVIGRRRRITFTS